MFKAVAGDALLAFRRLRVRWIFCVQAVGLDLFVGCHYALTVAGVAIRAASHHRELLEILFRRAVKGLPDVGRSDRSAAALKCGVSAEKWCWLRGPVLFLRASNGWFFHFLRELSLLQEMHCIYTER